MVPSPSSHQHGPPLLGRVPALPGSPTSTLLCSPPTPSSPSATAPVPLACDLPRCGRLFLAAGHVRSADVPSVGDFGPALRIAGFLRGTTRVSQVTGPSSSRVPWSNTPPDRDHCSPIYAEALVAFRLSDTLGIRNGQKFRGRIIHGPRARVPTLRRPRYRDRRQARYRLGRAHPWPGWIHTSWTTNEVSWRHRILLSPSTGIAWSHCFAYP